MAKKFDSEHETKLKGKKDDIEVNLNGKEKKPSTIKLKSDKHNKKTEENSEQKHEKIKMTKKEGYGGRDSVKKQIKIMEESIRQVENMCLKET